MSTKQIFVLKDAPEEIKHVAKVQPKGRTYDKTFSEQPGAIRIDEIVDGMKYASLAITDDEDGTLAEIGKANPWHIEALRIITGSEEEAHKPLTTILSKHMGLTCDKIIDISGVTPGGHPLDTQGYIAHNDEVIVLAYRCTTSAFDWLTNLNFTSSEWEIESDVRKGYSGRLSGLEGLCCQGGQYKPRVHTGFYNNFLASVPFIKEYIEPLLAPDQPPRKLYVVGHSLGAGIATLAACYFLLEMDWTQLPHKLINVTAGSPRAVRELMREKIAEEMKKLRPLDKAVICRIVRDKDVVPTVPPEIFGYKHLDKLVYITDDGEILVNPEVDDAHIIDENEMKQIKTANPWTTYLKSGSSSSSSSDDENEEKPSKYERMVAKIPKPFRDHMPDFYLAPLIKLFENEREENATVATKVADAAKSMKETLQASLEKSASSSSSSSSSEEGGAKAASTLVASLMKKGDTEEKSVKTTSSSDSSSDAGKKGAKASLTPSAKSSKTQSKYKNRKRFLCCLLKQKNVDVIEG